MHLFTLHRALLLFSSLFLLTSLGFCRFSPTDYTTSKHAVLGLLRSLYTTLHPHFPIRINAIAPSWTATGIVPEALIAVLREGAVQSPDVVARSVIYLFASQKGEGGERQHGACIYSDRGKFWDVENGPRGLNEYAKNMLGNGLVEEGVLDKLRAMAGVEGKDKGSLEKLKGAVGVEKTGEGEGSVE
jgi:hypothetical protein